MIGEFRYLGRSIGYLNFMAPGVVAVAIMFWSFFENTYSSFVRMYYQKTFDAIIATPLLVEDVILGELLWGTTKSLIASTIMTAVLTAFGLVSYPTGLWILPLAFLGGVIFSSLALIATSLTPNIDSFNFPIFIFIFPMFMFSGTFLPVDILPVWARTLAWCLPLTHVSLLVRGSCLGWYPHGWGWSLAYLVVLALASFVVALNLMKRRLHVGVGVSVGVPGLEQHRVRTHVPRVRRPGERRGPVAVVFVLRVGGKRARAEEKRVEVRIAGAFHRVEQQGAARHNRDRGRSGLDGRVVDPAIRRPERFVTSSCVTTAKWWKPPARRTT